VQKLGTGSYSEVYKVQRKSDGMIYALKKVSLENLSQKERENALNEVRILASIKHENIVGYKESFVIDGGKTLCIVMDYAPDGDLYQKICKNKKERSYFPEELVWRILIGSVQALACLHDLKIFHRDIKSANIFLNKNGLASLGDLNVSKVAKQGLLYTQTGTPYYASPEVWKDLPYDSKSDIWSLGCVFYEVLSLVPPFRAKDMNGLFKKVTAG
jgi:NIMA (never in mitosis gene a)-related kinase 1/4/5